MSSEQVETRMKGLSIASSSLDIGGMRKDDGADNDDEGGMKEKEREKEERENKEKEEKEKEKGTASVPFLKLFYFASGVDYLLLIFGTIGSIVHGAALPAFFYFFGDLINSFGKYQNDPVHMATEVAKYAVAFVYVGIAILIASWIDVACWMHSAERQATKMRKTYLEAILQQDIEFFDTEIDTGSLVESISSDTLLVQDAIGEKMGSFIHFMSTFVGGFIVGFISYWKIAIVMFAVLPAIAFAGGLYAYTLTKLSSQSQKAYGEAGSVAEQALTQIRTVLSFVGESKTIAAYSERLKVTVKLGYRGGMAKGLGMGVTYGILFCSWALILWYAGVLVRRNETNGGKAISAIFAVIIGGISIGQAMSNVTAFAKGKASLRVILDIIEKSPKMDYKLTDGATLSDVKGNIEFHHVAFSYPSRPDVRIFNDFSIHIPSGKTVAIVGGSGSGKSTVVSLIERFYDPIDGQVLLDGADIRTLQLKWLREQVGLVNQEPALFATSIKENILYGKPNASVQDIEEAAKAANAHGFINQLPEGYETQVGERGVQLSGGQKQRIAIARAMLKNPKILLLDEATSALDAASEKVVQEALDRLMVGRTTVVVAHRLSTIRNVDIIAVVQQGKIVEMGNHEELMEKGIDGTYSALVRLQEMAMASDGTVLTPRESSLGRPSVNSVSFRGSLGHRSSSLRRFSHQYSSGSERFEVDLNKAADDKGKNKRERKPSKSVYGRLVKLNAPEWPYAVLGTLGAVLSGLVNPIFAFIISEMISVYYNPDFSQMKSEIQKYTLIFVGMGVISLGVYFLQHYYFGIVGENLTGRLREMMLAAILRNEVGWFDKDENSSARLAARLSTDATNVRGAIGDRVSLLVQNSSAFITAIVIGLVVEWRLALVLLATFPLLVGAAVAQQFLMKGFAGDLEEVHSRATKVAGEAVANIRTVAAFNAESQVLHLFSSELSSLERRSSVRGNIAGAGFGIAQFCMFSSYGLALWYGSTLVKNGTSEFGPVIKVFMVLIVTAFAVAEALSLTPDFAKGGQALESVFSIIDRKTLIDPDEKEEKDTALVAQRTIKGDIEFRHVDFAYPTRPEVVLFKDFNLKVKAGQSVALVGASGSGKSSVISLIERFYDPNAGRVLIDGTDIKKVHLKWLRQHVGLVQQEPALFAESIYENILYGREGATQAEIEKAAKAANAHNFISGLPEGYKTMVGERGAQLSGGQKQRVAIARAVLKDPSILLLDEATSALDAESEKIVQQALDGLMEGRTSVVVAHRLSTIRGASFIAVVQDGKIIEQGSHSELMDIPHGSYASLVNLQSRNPTS